MHCLTFLTGKIRTLRSVWRTTLHRYVITMDALNHWSRNENRTHCTNHFRSWKLLMGIIILSPFFVSLSTVYETLCSSICEHHDVGSNSGNSLFWLTCRPVVSDRADEWGSPTAQQSTDPLALSGITQLRHSTVESTYHPIHSLILSFLFPSIHSSHPINCWEIAEITFIKLLWAKHYYLRTLKSVIIAQRNNDVHR